MRTFMSQNLSPRRQHVSYLKRYEIISIFLHKCLTNSFRWYIIFLAFGPKAPFPFFNIREADFNSPSRCTAGAMGNKISIFKLSKVVSTYKEENVHELVTSNINVGEYKQSINNIGSALMRDNKKIEWCTFRYYGGRHWIQCFNFVSFE